MGMSVNITISATTPLRLWLLGHSERRTLFLETSELVAQKTRAAIDAGLSVILWIGETLQEREAGTTINVVQQQLDAVVELVKVEGDWRLVPSARPFSALPLLNLSVCSQPFI